MSLHEHTPLVIRGLMISGSLFMSAMAARGIPQLATENQGEKIRTLVVIFLE